jgi:hypothetical protein
MGYPLSTFQQLARLCKDEPFVKKEFDRFRVVAIIVHAPDDDDFRRHLKYSFEHLHKVTDKGFAFLTFINPPSQWVEEHWAWMRTREWLSVGNGLDDDGEFVRALRRRLDLPDSPCLVLTGNLLSDRYIILPTSKDKVVPQMEAISWFVKANRGDRPIDERDFLRFLRRLGTAFEESTADGQSLARNIADLTAVKALTGVGAAGGEWERQKLRTEAHDYVRAALRKLWKAWKSGSEDSGSEDLAYKAPDRFCEYLGFILETDRGGAPERLRMVPRDGFEPLTFGCAMMVPRMVPRDGYPIPERMLEVVEPNTRIYLANFSRLVPLYMQHAPLGERNAIDLDGLSPSGMTLDFSPLGTYLGKAVEEEMNASLVQWARKIKGVHMPSYYRRYEEDLGDECRVYTSRTRFIKLNDKGKIFKTDFKTEYYDRAFTMGEVLSVLRVLRDEMDEMMARQMEPFCSDPYIDSFVENRNRACHQGIFKRDQFDSMYKEFMGVMDRELPVMVDLKNSLRAPHDPLYPPR